MNSKKTVRNHLNERKFIFKDVTTCIFEHSDGLESKIECDAKSDLVLVQVIPQSETQVDLQDKVLENYLKVKNVSELAELCGFNSERTFTRHFSKLFGKTPYKWLVERKMNEIHSLIINTNLSITEIAKKYNYNHVSNLSQIYLRHFGLSPLKSRRKHKEKQSTT